MTVIQVKVKPRAQVSLLERLDDGTYLAQLKSAPVEGAANAELVDLVARWFGCRKAMVSIKSGASSKLKLVAIDD